MIEILRVKEKCQQVRKGVMWGESDLHWEYCVSHHSLKTRTWKSKRHVYKLIVMEKEWFSAVHSFRKCSSFKLRHWVYKQGCVPRAQLCLVEHPDWICLIPDLLFCSPVNELFVMLLFLLSCLWPLCVQPSASTSLQEC